MKLTTTSYAKIPDSSNSQTWTASTLLPNKNSSISSPSRLSKTATLFRSEKNSRRNSRKREVWSTSRNWTRTNQLKLRRMSTQRWLKQAIWWVCACEQRPASEMWLSRCWPQTPSNKSTTMSLLTLRVQMALSLSFELISPTSPTRSRTLRLWKN